MGLVDLGHLEVVGVQLQFGQFVLVDLDVLDVTVDVFEDEAVVDQALVVALEDGLVLGGQLQVLVEPGDLGLIDLDGPQVIAQVLEDRVAGLERRVHLGQFGLADLDVCGVQPEFGQFVVVDLDVLDVAVDVFQLDGLAGLAVEVLDVEAGVIQLGLEGEVFEDEAVVDQALVVALEDGLVLGGQLNHLGGDAVTLGLRSLGRNGHRGLGRFGGGGATGPGRCDAGQAERRTDGQDAAEADEAELGPERNAGAAGTGVGGLGGVHWNLFRVGQMGGARWSICTMTHRI
ncbi:MAG: hypothetical protein AAF547_22230 [Actinomycetota bacterium]